MELPKYFYIRVRPKNMGTAVDLEDASDVDVVEVVRCKDCKFFRRYGFRLEYAECIKFDFYDTTEDGFCSYGERREDETN